MKTNKNATVKTENKSAKSAKVVAPKLSSAFLLVSGVRGYALRQVETYKEDGKVYFRATKDNAGLSIKGGGTFATLEKGIIVGPMTALLELGCYANGKRQGAKGEILTLAQFAAKSGKAIVKWNCDKDGVPCQYIGNPAVKGMLAVYVPSQNFAWQIEQDSNPNNKHERGQVLSVGKETLAVKNW